MNLKKTLLLTITSITLSFSSTNIDKYKELSKIPTDINQKMERFKNLQKANNKNFDLKKFEKIKEKSKTDLDKDIENSALIYSGDDYLSKKEYKTLTKKVLDARKTIKEDLASDYIIYLTSETVPNYAYMNIMHSVGILQENGIKIRTKQYLIGPPDDFKGYMMDKKAYMDKLTEKEKEKIINNFHLKLDPRLFHKFKLKKVPAIILAYCTSINPTEKTCKFKYLIRGDGSLTNFFDKISQTDKKYKKHYEVLLANKLIHNQDEEDINEKNNK